MVAFFVTVAVFIMEGLLHARMYDVRWAEAVGFILAPQMLTTMIAAMFVFTYLRDVMVRLKL